MMTPMKTLTNKKTNKTYEVIDERARIEIEKLKLLTSTDAVESITDYSTNKADVIISKKSGELIQTTDSANVKPKNIRLYGDCEQRRYEGYQLFDKESASDSSNWIDSTVLANIKAFPVYVGEGNAVSFKYLQSLTTGLGFYLYISLTNEKRDFFVYHSDDSSFINNDIEFTATEDYIYLLCYETQISLFMQYIGNELMINLGDTPKDWEPYTNNEPSPSARYPQTVNYKGANGSIENQLLSGNLFKPNVSVINCTYEGDGVYSVESGKGNFLINTDMSSYGIQETKIPNGSVRLTFEIEAVNTFTVGNVFLCTDGSKKYNYGFTVNQTTTNGILKVSKALTLTNDVNKIGLCVYGNTVDGLKIKNIQLTIGMDEKEYQPYSEQPFIALTPNGFKGIGGIRDEKDYEQNDNIQRVYRQVLDGNSQIVRLDDDLAEHNTTRFVIQLDHKGLYSDVASALCTHAWGKIMWVEDVEGFYVDGNTVIFRVNSSTCGTTQEEVKAWLQSEYDKGTPVEVHYVLAEPIITNLTEEEKEQYDALCMNYPCTTLLNSDDALVEIEYINDTQSHLENHYTKKSKWRLIHSVTLEQDVNQIYLTEDDDGKPLKLSAFMVVVENPVIGGNNANVFVEAAPNIDENMRVACLVGGNCWTANTWASSYGKCAILTLDEKFCYMYSFRDTTIEPVVVEKYNIDAFRKIGFRCSGATLIDGYTGLIGTGTKITFYGKDV